MSPPQVLLPSLRQLPGAVWHDTSSIVGNVKRSWRVLWALTVVESRRKYAGSVLGMLWYPMYAALLLASYCFLYLVVFKIRFKDLGSYEYVLFVFSGLIPFLGFSEAVSTSTTSVRSNLSILKNSVFPIEFVPIRSVCAALFGLISSLAILTLMVLPTSHFGWHLLYLPVSLLELFALCITAAWILSAVAVLVPDVARLVNIGLMLLRCLAPVGYTLEMVPESAQFLLFLNPLTYPIESFRYAILGTREMPHWVDGVFLGGCLISAALAGTFFKRISPVFADYE